jgi:lambda repressor-like predicted transcriptional regulator
MATRTKPNWKVLDSLLPMLEKEGWSHTQIAEDWGISPATLEKHLTQEATMPPPRYINWEHFDALKAQGLSMPRISEAMAIPKRTLEDRLRQRRKEHQGTPDRHQGTPEEHPSTPEHPGTLEGHQEVMEDISQSVPDAPHIGTDAIRVHLTLRAAKCWRKRSGGHCEKFLPGCHQVAYNAGS